MASGIFVFYGEKEEDLKKASGKFTFYYKGQ